MGGVGVCLACGPAGEHVVEYLVEVCMRVREREMERGGETER